MQSPGLGGLQTPLAGSHKQTPGVTETAPSAWCRQEFGAGGARRVRVCSHSSSCRVSGWKKLGEAGDGGACRLMRSLGSCWSGRQHHGVEEPGLGSPLPGCAEGAVPSPARQWGAVPSLRSCRPPDTMGPAPRVHPLHTDEVPEVPPWGSGLQSPRAVSAQVL